MKCRCLKKIWGIFNKHTSLQFLKITFLDCNRVKPLETAPPPPTPPFTGCCQKEMNNVFEIFTNIRCGWGSSLWEPEIYFTFSIWTSLNKKLFPILSVTVSYCHTRCRDKFSIPSVFILSVLISLVVLFWDLGMRCERFVGPSLAHHRGKFWAIQAGQECSICMIHASHKVLIYW